MYDKLPSAYIAVTGPPGVGKTTLVNQIQSLSPAQLDGRLGEYREIHGIHTRQLLRWNGFEGRPSIVAMQAYHAHVRREGQAAAIFEPLKSIIGSLVIIDSLRHPDDVEIVHDMGGLVVALSAPQPVTNHRFLTSSNDIKHAEALGLDDGFDRVNSNHRVRNLALARLEMTGKSLHAPGSNIEACMEKADVIIDANRPQPIVQQDFHEHVVAYALTVQDWDQNPASAIAQPV